MHVMGDGSDIQRQAFVENPLNVADLAGNLSRASLLGQLRYNNPRRVDLSAPDCQLSVPSGHWKNASGNQDGLAPYYSTRPCFIDPSDAVFENRRELPDLTLGGSDLSFMGDPQVTALLESTAIHSECSGPPADAPLHFTDNVQNEANAMFQAVYSQNNQCVINEFLNQLKNLKNSLSQKDHEILACVVTNLFEEYRFFPEYPEKELRTTAEIFGGFIREKLLTYGYLACAVAIIVGSVRSPPHSKLWNFGVTSLTAAHTALRNMPKVCAFLATLKGYQYFPAPLKLVIEAGTQNQLPQLQTSEVSSWRSAPSTNIHHNDGIEKSHNVGTNIFATANVDTLVSASEVVGKGVKQPPEIIVGKVAFLFNNLTQSCISEKAREMQKLVEEYGDEFCRWLAQYIVIKRVSVENNFQPLYKDFLISLNDKRLDGHILRETFRNIKILLQCERKQSASNFSDRQLLKNLGLWLGKITIARDRPIVISDLDLKSLLLEANMKGEHELLLVIPFITKIVGASSSSKIFHPSCAWIRSILRLLKESHDQEIKLNLKFEIEVLFKDLNVDIKTQTTDGLLENTNSRSRLIEQLGSKAIEKAKEFPNNLSLVKLEPETKNRCGFPEARTKVEVVVKKVETLGPDVCDSLQWLPNYSYHEINVSSINALLPFIKVNSVQPFVQVTPQLLRAVYSAVNLAIGDHIAYSTARSCKIAIEVSWSVCSKDFAFDTENSRYSQALMSVVYGLTSGMTYVTSRDLLHDRLQKYLTESLKNILGGGNPLSAEQEELLEKVAFCLTDENIEVATCFVVKTACEKAAQEIHKIVAGHEKIDARRQLSANAIAAIQQLPERIRPGSVTAFQFAVYNEFSNNLCGFKKLGCGFSGNASTQSVKRTELRQRDKKIEQFKTLIQAVVRDIDVILSGNGVQLLKVSGALSAVREGLLRILLKPDNQVLQYGFLQKLLYQMSNNFTADSAVGNKKLADLSVQMEIEWSKRLKYVYLNVCKAFLFHLGQDELSRLFSRILCDSALQHKFNSDFLNLLLEQGLFQIGLFDRYLALRINSENSEVLSYVQNLVKQGRRELPLATERLLKMQLIQSRSSSTLPSLPTNLTPHQIPSSLQMANGSYFTGKNLATVDTSGKLTGTKNDVPLKSGKIITVDNLIVDRTHPLREKAEKVLREWIQLCYTVEAQRQPERALGLIVRIMGELNVISSDAAITEFFHACAYVCADVTYRLLKNDPNAEQATPARQRCYYTLDAFAKLACLMVKCSSGCHAQTKVSLLVKILDAVEEVLCEDYKTHGSDFCPMPHQRMFMVMFNELTEPDASLDPIAWNIIEAFGRALSNLRPRRIPGFAFAWLNIIGHRNFISRLLKSDVEPVKTAAMYTQLLLYQLKFLSPFLRNVEMPKSLISLYKGTLRILYVIRHDFPELLCEYYCVFCDAIPTNCVHLRNLILSAYPRNMHLPNLYSLDLKAQDLPELLQEPKTQINVTNLIPPTLLQQLHEYLAERLPDSFLASLPNQLQNAPQATSLPGLRYNSTLMNALIMHIGSLALKNITRKPQCSFFMVVAKMRHIKIFQSLAEHLCNEGRYMLFNGMVDHLRYPCNHTYYFCFALLHIFLEAKTNAVREQITRTLFERVLAPKPHPWGLLLTIIELVKNPKYSLWSHDFLHCEPYFESFCGRLIAYQNSSINGIREGDFEESFGDLSRSCMTPTMFADPRD